MGQSELLASEFVVAVVATVEQTPDEVRFPYQYDKQTGVLWIQLSRAYSWWLSERRATGQASLRLHHLKTALKAKSIYSAGHNLYLVGPTRRAFMGTTKWMHGLDLRACFDAGLDVPDTLSVIVPAGHKILTHDGGLHEIAAHNSGEELTDFVAPMDTE